MSKVAKLKTIHTCGYAYPASTMAEKYFRGETGMYYLAERRESLDPLHYKDVMIGYPLIFESRDDLKKFVIRNNVKLSDSERNWLFNYAR